MEFALRYDGQLAGGQSSHQREIKNALRLTFHRQLEQLVSTRWDLRAAVSRELPVAILNGERLEVPGGMPDGFFIVERAGIQWVPMYSQIRADFIKVRIEIYRRQWLHGILYPGGDLDNQAKVILDGLRLPQDDNESKDFDMPAGSRCYCLLENDSLISEVSIASKQHLIDAQPGYASLMIYVDVTPARWVNM